MIVVDIETVSLDTESCGIVSIGAVDLLQCKNTFYEECRAFDDLEISAAALRVNGFTLDSIFDVRKPFADQTVKHFIDWVNSLGYQKPIFLSSPATFDEPFLKHIAREAKLIWPFSHRTLDLHSVAYGFRTRQNPNVTPDSGNDAILQYVGLPPEPKPHHGLAGAKYEAEAFARILWGIQLQDEFKQYPVPHYLRVEVTHG
jgi:hypothetical protein